MEPLLKDIEVTHNHDVLSGRGNNINSHSGNRYFRSLVNKLKVEYVATQKAEKGMFAKLIVTQIRGLNPPGRFLKQNPDTGLWDDIGDKKAVDKTRQALREQAPEIEEKLKKGELTVKTVSVFTLIFLSSNRIIENQSLGWINMNAGHPSLPITIRVVHFLRSPSHGIFNLSIYSMSWLA